MNDAIRIVKDEREAIVEIRREHRILVKPEERPAPWNLSCRRWWKDGKGHQRDTQRGKAYKAERQVWGRADVHQRIFSELDDLAEYCQQVMERDWFQRRWPKFYQLNVTLINRKFCQGGPANHFYNGPDRQKADKLVTNGRIWMTPWGMGWSDTFGGEMIVLHELAHAICPLGEAHGRLWARTYIELVRYQMGHRVADLLEEAFTLNNVRFRPFKLVSEETKARLAACRPPGFGQRIIVRTVPAT
jgi:putative metallohydrolase (TIGR04338 family)